MNHDTELACLGLNIRVETDAAWLIEQAVRAFPFNARPSADHGDADRVYRLSAAPGDGYHVSVDGAAAFEAADLPTLRSRLRLDLRTFITTRSPAYLFVHAGAVAWNGCGIILPGLSRSGKSTLVAALVEAGAVLYGDDYAILDADGRLHPSSPTLSLRTADGRKEVTAEEIGGVRGHEPVDLGAVLLLTYDPAADEDAPLMLRPLSLAEAIHQTLIHTPAARDHFSASIERLTKAYRNAKLSTGARGEASRVSSEILRQCL